MCLGIAQCTVRHRFTTLGFPNPGDSRVARNPKRATKRKSKKWGRMREPKNVHSARKMKIDENGFRTVKRKKKREGETGRSSFGGLVLGCIKADFCEYIHSRVQLIFISITLNDFQNFKDLSSRCYCMRLITFV